MYLLVLFLPLLSFLLLGIFGQKLGKRGSIVISLLCMILSLLTAFLIYYEVALSHSNCILKLFSWMDIGFLNIQWSFLYDTLTSIMLIIVIFVSLLVHLYSVGYMSDDAHIIRFISYLSLFTFFMLMLVTANNFFQLFIGWEGVGLVSYLLINFWFTRLQANKSAMKAMIINRIGDLGLLFGIIVIFLTFKTLNFSTVFSLIPLYLDNTFNFLFIDVNVITLISILLFIGTIGKSAQLGLHMWLPDAMEGPTPVSALIHAATMVTAGVFLLLRCSFLINYSISALIIITIIGALTAFFAATIGVVQNDLKKVIAYSTCSQLGYMVFSCGLSNYSVSIFHLANHAFFKALLFLSAGVIIHALCDEQDMRRMGGLINLLPFTYMVMVIASLALIGFPFLTGFYSKDIILEVAFVQSYYKWNAQFIYFFGVLTAFLTAFYSFRLIFLVFFYKTNSFIKRLFFVKDASFTLGFPLFILALFSIFVGFVTKDMFLGFGSFFWNNSLFLNYYFIESEFIFFVIKLIPVIFSIFGVILSYYSYLFLNDSILALKVYFKKLYFFLIKKWYFDYIVNNFIVSFFFKIAYKDTFQNIDRGILEFFGPNGLSITFNIFSKFATKLQSGYIFHYIFIMVLALILFILLYFYSFDFIFFVLLLFLYTIDYYKGNIIK